MSMQKFSRTLLLTERRRFTQSTPNFNPPSTFLRHPTTPPSLRAAACTHPHLSSRSRFLHSTPISHRAQSTQSAQSANKQPFVNILADEHPPPVQVTSVSSNGIKLADGLVIPSACIFLEGKVYLWDVPTPSSTPTTTKTSTSKTTKTKTETTTESTFWDGWEKDHFEVFEVVVPKPEILLLGTGKTMSQPPPFLREYLNKMGIQLDVMDTRNACSTYNLLAEEGRRVAAALLPLTPRAWQKIPTGSA